MQLTPKAEALRDPLKRALAALSGVIDTPETDVRQIERTVRLAMADIPASLLAVPLLNTLQRIAPGITLALLPWMSANDALHGLEKARMDLAVAVIPDVSGKLRRELLIQGSFVIAMRAAHPAAKQFSLDSWLAHPHVMVSSHGARRSPLDEQLLQHGRTRHVAIVVPSFLVVLPLLEKSNCIAMLPRQIMGLPQARKLAFFEPPLKIDGFPVHLAWHERSDNDMAVSHVAQAIRDAIEAEEGPR